MKKLLLAALAASAVLYYLMSPTPPPAPRPVSVQPSTSSRDEVDDPDAGLVVPSEMKGDIFSARLEGNHVEYRKVGDFSDEFRVFGVSPNEDKDSPLNHVSAFVTLARLSEVRAAVARDGCERNAAAAAKTVAMVVTDEAVASRLEELVEEGGELRLSGGILERESHTYEGSSPPPMSGVDIGKIYLLASLEPVPSRPAQPVPGATGVTVPSASSAYSWDFSETDKVSQPKQVAPRPKCKQRRVVRVIRRCPR